jgi:hypothetical protein
MCRNTSDSRARAGERLCFRTTAYKHKNTVRTFTVSRFSANDVAMVTSDWTVYEKPSGMTFTGSFLRDVLCKLVFDIDVACNMTFH